MDAPSSLEKNEKASLTAESSGTRGAHISACVCVVPKAPGKMLCMQEVFKFCARDFTRRRARSLELASKIHPHQGEDALKTTRNSSFQGKLFSPEGRGEDDKGQDKDSSLEASLLVGQQPHSQGLCQPRQLHAKRENPKEVLGSSLFLFH